VHVLNSERAVGAACCAQCGLIHGIVGNVLTAPQVEAGQLSLQHDIFSPAAVIGDVLQACRLAARGCSIDWERAPADAPLPALVEADRNRIAQVVQNTITNACRFSEGTPVRVRATLQAQQPGGQPWLAIRVRDEGRGMSPHEAAACFNSGQAAPASAGGGSGLGLYSALWPPHGMHACALACVRQCMNCALGLSRARTRTCCLRARFSVSVACLPAVSRAFAALMGGTLCVESRPSEGSAFTLRVPVRVLDERETAVVAAAAAANAAALLLAERQLEERDAAAAAAAVATAAAPAQPEGKRPRKAPSRVRRFHVLVAVRALACRLRHACVCAARKTTLRGARLAHARAAWLAPSSLKRRLNQDDHPVRHPLLIDNHASSGVPRAVCCGRRHAPQPGACKLA
jgi:hypothetical protein